MFSQKLIPDDFDIWFWGKSFLLMVFFALLSYFKFILWLTDIIAIFPISSKWFQETGRNLFKKRRKLPLKVLPLMTKRVLKWWSKTHNAKSKTHKARKEYYLYAIWYKSYDIKTVSDDFLISYVVISSSFSNDQRLATSQLFDRMCTNRGLHFTTKYCAQRMVRNVVM